MFGSKNDSSKEFLPWYLVYKSYGQACQAALNVAADFHQKDDLYLEPTASEEETEFHPGTIVAKVNGMTYYVYQVSLAADEDDVVGEFVTEQIKSLMTTEASNWGGTPGEDARNKALVRTAAKAMLVAARDPAEEVARLEAERVAAYKFREAKAAAKNPVRYAERDAARAEKVAAKADAYAKALAKKIEDSKAAAITLEAAKA
jgi:hypothetical protein